MPKVISFISVFASINILLKTFSKTGLNIHELLFISKSPIFFIKFCILWQIFPIIVGSLQFFNSDDKISNVFPNLDYSKILGIIFVILYIK